MSSYIDALIFDRTASDISNLTDKGCIDYKDLNRVEMAIKWVSHVLNRYGYKNKVIIKTWFPEDKRTDREMERIRNNISIIREAYYTPNSTPLTPSKITYTSIYQANAIEQIIYDIGNLIEKSFPSPNYLSFRLGARKIGNRSVAL